MFAPLLVASLLGVAGLVFEQAKDWQGSTTNPADEVTVGVSDVGLRDEGITLALDRPVPLDAGGAPDCGVEPECDLPSSEEHAVRTWLRELGAVDVSTTHRQLVVENTSNRGVEIVGGRAVVDERSQEAPAATVHFPTDGASDTIALLFDLDTDQAPALDGATADSPEDASRYFDRKFITLRPGERQPIDIVALSSADDVSWHLEFDVISEDEPKTIAVRPSFRTVGGVAASGADSHWRWQGEHFVREPTTSQEPG